MSVKIEGLKQETLAVEGPDAVGKERTSHEIGMQLYGADFVEVDGVQYERHEIILSEPTFPFYCFPSGDFVRLMNKGLGSEYAQMNNLTVEEEVRLRKAMYAVDRYLFYMAEALWLSENVDSRHKLLLRIQDRSALSQIHTEVAVYLGRGLKYQLDINSLTDSDQELMNSISFRNAVLIPFSSSTSALKERNIEITDELEAPSAQEVATKIYTDIAVNMHFGSHPISVQHDGGEWRDTKEIMRDIFNKTRILPETDFVDESQNIGKIAFERERKGGVNYMHSAYDMAQAFTYMVEHFMMRGEYENKWLAIKRAPADSFRGHVKKELLYNEEFRVARKIDDELRRHRVDPDILDRVPQYLIEGIVRLFTDYTDGRLWDFNKYIYQHKARVLKDGVEPDPLYGRGYLLFLRELFEFSKEKLGQA